MSTPQEIQAKIERTRESLSADVDRLSDKVSPGKVVGRRVDRVKGGARFAKEKVMGVSDNAAQSVSGAAGEAGGAVGSIASSVGDVASSAGEVVTNAPQQARRQTQGNPVAAGVIAFGVGWLISSLLPASQAERQVAQQAEDRAKDLAEPLKDTAQEIAGNLQEPAQQAFDQVRSTATDAAHETVAQARSSVEDVKAPITG
ncbi:MAG: hypothetical protein QOE97_26 [Pseudonocardiales bacterium]|jgi:F0F1-type ATP synthase membrane subunit b/b'|nr:hypothetical protein [Pseudonocardiales bacterium]